MEIDDVKEVDDVDDIKEVDNVHDSMEIDDIKEVDDSKKMEKLKWYIVKTNTPKITDLLIGSLVSSDRDGSSHYYELHIYKCLILNDLKYNPKIKFKHTMTGNNVALTKNLKSLILLEGHKLFFRKGDCKEG